MRSRDTDIVIVPDLGGSGPDHWQSRWQAKLPNAHRVEQDDWDHPNRPAWTSRLVETVRTCKRPVVVVAHSLGVVTLAHAAAEGLVDIAGAFLVAPVSDRAILAFPVVDAAFRPTPLRRMAFPSTVVGSHDDPHSSIEEAAALAEAWGSTFIDAGSAGHINIASGHGPWPEGLMAFAGFLSKLAPPEPDQRA